MGREIASPELTAGDLPAEDADEAAIREFAAKFDGFQYIESKAADFGGRVDPVARLGVLANTARGRFFRKGMVEVSEELDELRACLFFEWKRLEHQGRSADDGMMDYLRALVEAIRWKVTGTEGG